jgi:hypothetical protein
MCFVAEIARRNFQIEFASVKHGPFASGFVVSIAQFTTVPPAKEMVVGQSVDDESRTGDMMTFGRGPTPRFISFDHNAADRSRATYRYNADSARRQQLRGSIRSIA